MFRKNTQKMVTERGQSATVVVASRNKPLIISIVIKILKLTIKKYKLGLSCAKLRSALASYPLA